MNAKNLGGWLLRLALGGVLVYAAFPKLAEAHAFAGAIARYRLLPATFNQILAVTLPWIELAAGMLLVLRLWVRPAALLAAGLAVIFTLAVGSALARGLDITCGCFGTEGGARVGAWVLALDLGLLAGAWVVYRLERETGPRKDLDEGKR